MGTPISYDTTAGLPIDKSYLEYDLPPFLVESIAAMEEAWKKTGKRREI